MQRWRQRLTQIPRWAVERPELAHCSRRSQQTRPQPTQAASQLSNSKSWHLRLLSQFPRVIVASRDRRSYPQ